MACRRSRPLSSPKDPGVALAEILHSPNLAIFENLCVCAGRELRPDSHPPAREYSCLNWGRYGQGPHSNPRRTRVNRTEGEVPWRQQEVPERLHRRRGPVRWRRRPA